MLNTSPAFRLSEFTDCSARSPEERGWEEVHRDHDLPSFTVSSITHANPSSFLVLSMSDPNDMYHEALFAHFLLRQQCPEE